MIILLTDIICSGCLVHWSQMRWDEASMKITFLSRVIVRNVVDSIRPIENTATQNGPGVTWVVTSGIGD